MPWLVTKSGDERPNQQYPEDSHAQLTHHIYPYHSCDPSLHPDIAHVATYNQSRFIPDSCTVFLRIDAAAFIYFVGQFGAATIRGRRLFEGGDYFFRQYDPSRVPRIRPQHPAEVLSTSR